MLILSASLRRVTLINQTYAARAFSTQVADANAKRAVTKTVKAFASLPTAHLRPDGSVAEALDDWWGGPDQKHPTISSSREVEPPRKRRRVAAVFDTTGTLGPHIDDPPIKTRGRKAKNAVIEVDNNEVEPILRPKRGRKPKVAPPETLITVPKEPALKSVKLDDSPQTILAKEILENLRKFPHCLLLTRVGQFYESYFDQAVEISRLLNIKLTTRKWGRGRVPMCGFPLMHLDKSLKTLVQQNKRFVAMCEEFPRYSDTGVKVFDRRVARVITPGTLIDELFLNPFENNYLLAISVPVPTGSMSNTTCLGLAWIDVSTGEFFSKNTTVDSLRDELARIGPREVVLDHSMEQMKHHPIFEALAEDDNFISFFAPSKTLPQTESITDGLPTLTSNPTGTPSLDDIQAKKTAVGPDETSAIGLLTAYLNANLLDYMPVLSLPNREGTEGRMQIDSHTIKALEIREGFREGGTKGSLLSTIKRTVTSGGSRLLSRWLCSPSTSIAEINSRQSLVAFFHSRPHFHADLAEALTEAEDTGRIVQKFILGRGDPDDLLAVQRTTHIWSSIVKRVKDEKQLEAVERSDFDEEEWASLDSLMSRMVDLRDLSKRISMVLEGGSSGGDEPASESTTKGEVEENSRLPSSFETDGVWRYGPAKWSIKPGFSPTLTSLHSSLRSLLCRREELQRDLQLKYDAPSLTLRASPAQGMHVHLAKAKRDQTKMNASPEFISIAESGTTRCYFWKDWSQLGGQIADTTQALIVAEKEAFEMIRGEVNSHSQSLRRNVRLLDELDVALSFAKLATELNFVRPILTNEAVYNVTNGRHPTVELGLLAVGRVFTPNSITLSPTSRLHVITGPNMAGKSTFLRQTALMAILAQSGSFIPADFATVGVVDKLFSRVGAKDDLFHDRSTFMVEMLETAEILRRATPRSLVIMDEVGRGTTVTDGLAIAYATLHHLVTQNKCRTLFATHFHELSDMLGYPNQCGGIFEGVDFFCTNVDEVDDDLFAYQYRVCPGVNRDSHGLKVAQLAGMPPAAVAVAKDTLSWLKARKADTSSTKMP